MWIGISLGDVTGIGPEVTLKALAVEAQATTRAYLLIGDAGCASALNQQLGLNLPLQTYAGSDRRRPHLHLQSAGRTVAGGSGRRVTRRRARRGRLGARRRASAVCAGNSTRWSPRR